MTEPSAIGGCQCGAVRYVLRGARSVYTCHCLECQKQTASAFAMSIPLLADRLTLQGQPEVYSRSAFSGGITQCRFCRSCGTRLYHQSSRSPEYVTLKAGTLDDSTGLEPVAHLWISRKQPWVILDPTIPAFDTQPENFAEWRAGLVDS